MGTPTERTLRPSIPYDMDPLGSFQQPPEPFGLSTLVWAHGAHLEDPGSEPLLLKAPI